MVTVRKTETETTNQNHKQNYKKTMLAILKPFVLSALRSPKFKTFVVELLEKLVEQSDNNLDNKALAVVKKGLGL